MFKLLLSVLAVTYLHVRTSYLKLGYYLRSIRELCIVVLIDGRQPEVNPACGLLCVKLQVVSFEPLKKRPHVFGGGLLGISVGQVFAVLKGLTFSAAKRCMPHYYITLLIRVQNLLQIILECCPKNPGPVATSLPGGSTDARYV